MPIPKAATAAAGIRMKGGIDRRDSFHVWAYSSRVGVHSSLVGLSRRVIFKIEVEYLIGAYNVDMNVSVRVYVSMVIENQFE